MGVKEHNYQKWFYRWLKDGYTVSQLTELSRLSRRNLLKIIYSCLEKELDIKAPNIESKYLVFDGTYLYKRKLTLAVLIDDETGKLVAWEYGLDERKTDQLIVFFNKLKLKGVMPVSCTVDGNFMVMKALRQVWPSILIQRCLVHVQRQGLMWCRSYPKTTMGRQLRKLFISLLYIHTHEKKKEWLEQVQKWENRYGKSLKGPVHGWVMSDLKRARSMLLKGVSDLFHYISDTRIPFSSNRAEGFFSVLKRSYKKHAGLSTHHRKQYISWFCANSS